MCFTLDRCRFLRFFNTGICTVTYAKYLLIVFEKPTDNSWHGTFLLKAKLCVLGTQKWAPKILTENDRGGAWKRKIQGVVKYNAWTVGLASCWKWLDSLRKCCQNYDKRSSNGSQDYITSMIYSWRFVKRKYHWFGIS